MFVPARDWTFERLARSDRPTLERILRSSAAPEVEQLCEYAYAGYNHDWLGQLPGAKFKKVFYKADHGWFGYNQVVIQDGRAPSGDWRLRLRRGRPQRRGYFRILTGREAPPEKYARHYPNLLRFDYDIDLNPRWNAPLRSIRDVVGSPNPGDCSVLLGKAYFRLLPGTFVFASYFVLGHRLAERSHT